MTEQWYILYTRERQTKRSLLQQVLDSSLEKQKKTLLSMKYYSQKALTYQDKICF